MSNRSALEGVKVIDLTQFASGPICTLMLAQLGAEVIKVEKPGVGEAGRKDSKPFTMTSSNKRSVTLDLKKPESHKVMDDLIRYGDIIIENFAPGTMARLGYPWEVIHEINPKIIYCSIKGYADNSPYSKFPAFDGAVQATGTLISQTGMAGGPPVCPGVALADDLAGRFAATGVIAALYQRTNTGEGQQVRINMQEVMIAVSSMNIPNIAAMAQKGEQFNGVQRGIYMSFAGRQCPVDMFETKPADENDTDNYIFLCLLDSNGPQPWINFCKLIGRQDWIDDVSMHKGSGRIEHKAEIYEEVTKWTKQHDKVEAMTILAENKIVSGAVLSLADIVNEESNYEYFSV